MKTWKELLHAADLMHHNCRMIFMAYLLYQEADRKRAERFPE